MVELQDEVLGRLAAQTDKLKGEGDAAVEQFIRATVSFRSAFLVEAVCTYLKNEASRPFGHLDESRRTAFRDEVMEFVTKDPQRVRAWLESVAWPHRKRIFRETDREFNKPSSDYGQLEATVQGLSDGLALILKRHGLGMSKDAETVRRLHDGVFRGEKWSPEMNDAWDRIERVKKQIAEVEKERDERIGVLAREKIAREIDELFYGVPEESAAA